MPKLTRFSRELLLPPISSQRGAVDKELAAERDSRGPSSDEDDPDRVSYLFTGHPKKTWEPPPALVREERSLRHHLIESTIRSFDNGFRSHLAIVIKFGKHTRASRPKTEAKKDPAWRGLHEGEEWGRHNYRNLKLDALEKVSSGKVRPPLRQSISVIVVVVLQRREKWLRVANPTGSPGNGRTPADKATTTAAVNLCCLTFFSPPITPLLCWSSREREIHFDDPWTKRQHWKSFLPLVVVVGLMLMLFVYAKLHQRKCWNVKPSRWKVLLRKTDNMCVTFWALY